MITLTRVLQTGVDAMEFAAAIPDDVWNQIDTIVWDPPYMDLNNPKHKKKMLGGQKSQRHNLSKTHYTRILDIDYRDKLLSYIKSKTNDIYIIHFHTDEEILNNIEGCSHVWVKGKNTSMTGSACVNNAELIKVEGTKIKREKGRILDKYLWIPFNFPPRACAKPVKLWLELFRHIDSKFVLDPFAGYGNSILACDKMDISIYACDLDDTLTWGKQSKINDYF